MASDPSTNARAALDQVNAVTLPKIYREIGRRVAKSPKPPSVLKHHFDAIARLKPAADAKNPAAVAELREVYAALGREAVEKYGDRAVPKDIAPLLANALAEQRELSATPTIRLTRPSRKAKRSVPLFAYAMFALAAVTASIATVMLWPKAVSNLGEGSAAPVSPARPSAGDAVVAQNAQNGRVPATAAKRPASTQSSQPSKSLTASLAVPDLDALVVAFSAEDATRLRELAATAKNGPSVARPMSRDEEAAAITEKLLAATKTELEGLAKLNAVGAIQQAMANISSNWIKATEPLAAPLEDDPALREHLQGSGRALLALNVDRASEAIQERYQRAINDLKQSLDDAQESVGLAFGGKDDLGRPFLRQPAEQQRMLASAISRFAVGFEQRTRDVARWRVDEVRQVLSAANQKSERCARCAEAMLMDIKRAELQWRKRVGGVRESLARYLHDGQQFTTPDSAPAFAKIASEQSSRLSEVVAAESRELSVFWSSISAEMVKAIAQAADLDELEDQQRELAARLEARWNTAREVLDEAHDEVGKVFARRMEEEQRRADNAMAANRRPSGSNPPNTVAAQPAVDDVIPRRFFEQRIVVGMPMEEVLALLGPPDSVMDGESPIIVWDYYRVKDEVTGKGCAMVAIFRPTGRVKDVQSIPINREDVRKRR